MRHQNRFLRALQRASDAVQDATGWTCFRQAAILGLLAATAFAWSAVAAAIAGGGGMDLLATACVFGNLNVIAIVVMTPTGTSLAEAMSRRRMRWVMIPAGMGIALTAMCALSWSLTVPWHASGALPNEVSLSMTLEEIACALVMLKADREFRRKCADGELTAFKPDDDAIFAEPILGAALVINAIAHGFDHTSVAGALAAPAFILSTLLGRCRPRPPRPKRKRSEARWAHAERA